MSKNLELCVKQGEVLDIPFTIKQDGVPLDLTNYTISFQVKKVPLVTAEPIINKEITTTSDRSDVGIILEPTVGKLIVHLKEEDTSFNTGEYSLVVSLIGNNEVNIISSDCCNSAIYRICEQ